MSWINQCNFWSSPKAYRGPGYGENIWQGAKNLDRTTAANQSTTDWFNQLQWGGYLIGQDNVLTEDGYQLGVSSYSQVVWQKTLSIGCGVVPCSDNIMAGCHYKYATQVGDVIYEMGSPCATDEDCKCIGCKCSKDEALCLVPPQTKSQNSYWKN
ncbi:hypothetical protein OSTOST_07092 [Ostertagia ostertagi]